MRNEKYLAIFIAKIDEAGFSTLTIAEFAGNSVQAIQSIISRIPSGTKFAGLSTILSDKLSTFTTI